MSENTKSDFLKKFIKKSYWLVIFSLLYGAIYWYLGYLSPVIVLLILATYCLFVVDGSLTKLITRRWVAVNQVRYTYFLFFIACALLCAYLGYKLMSEHYQLYLYKLSIYEGDNFMKYEALINELHYDIFEIILSLFFVFLCFAKHFSYGAVKFLEPVKVKIIFIIIAIVSVLGVSAKVFGKVTLDEHMKDEIVKYIEDETFFPGSRLTPIIKNITLQGQYRDSIKFDKFNRKTVIIASVDIDLETDDLDEIGEFDVRQYQRYLTYQYVEIEEDIVVMVHANVCDVYDDTYIIEVDLPY